MWKYYRGILSELPAALRAALESVLFWVMVIVTVATFFWPRVGSFQEAYPLPRQLWMIGIGVLVLWLMLRINYGRLVNAEEKADSAKHELETLREAKPRPRIEIVKGKRSQSDMYNVRQEWGVRVHNDGVGALFMGTVEIVGDSGNPLERMEGRFPVDWHGTEVIKRHIMKGDYETLYFGYVETYPTMSHVTPRIMVRFFVENMASRKDCFESSRIVGGPPDPFVIVDLTIYSDPAPVGLPPTLRLKLSSAGMVVP